MLLKQCQCLSSVFSFDDSKAVSLEYSTNYVAKYRLVFRQMRAFAAEQGLRFLIEFDLGILRKFRAGWVDKNISASKKLERLRAFLRFAQDRVDSGESGAEVEEAN